MNGNPTLTLSMPDGVTYSVAFDRFDLDRIRYSWRIAVESHNVADAASDLSMVQYEPDLADALRTLLCFANGDPSLFPNLTAAGLDLAQCAEDAAMELGGEDE